MPSLALVAEILFVALFAIVVPVLAVASRKRFDDGRVPRGRDLYVQVSVQLVILGALSVAVAVLTDRPVFTAPRLDLPTLAASAAFLGLALGSIPWRFRRASETDRARLRRLTPAGRADAPSWIVLCLAAGFSEELAYRGLLTGILADWTGSVALGAVGSALAVGLAHAVQGAKSMAAVFGFGLAFQALCALSGSLLPAMIVHATYDLAAGAIYARLDPRRDDVERSSRIGS